MKINNRVISHENEPYIIAELSANHNGDIQRAFDSILAAKEAGADAVKIQIEGTSKSGKKSIQAYKCGFTSEGHILKGIVKTR
jgi:sialic acid synthase SpsE